MVFDLDSNLGIAYHKDFIQNYLNPLKPKTILIRPAQS